MTHEQTQQTAINPTGKIIIKLPYPHKILGITISLKRPIGFMFTNLSMYLFRENIGIKTSEDYKEWLTKNGEIKLISEILYAAAIAFCMTERKQNNFTKRGLLQAINGADEQTRDMLVNAWKMSTDFIDKKKVSPVIQKTVPYKKTK